MTMVKSLAWGWWKSRDSIPTALGDERNFVLTKEELEAYVNELVAMEKEIQHERVLAARNLMAITRHKVPSFERDPRCTALTHVMEFMLTLGNAKLQVVNLLNETAKKRREAREAAVRG
jgi:hypothetical protein